MLKKLIQLEISATRRFLIPILGVTILLTLISKGMSFLPDVFPISIFKGIIIAATIIALIGSFIVSLILLIQRFYKTMTGNEGYFTHTLPATTTQLLTAKAIWTTASLILVTVVDILMLILLLPFDDISQIGKVIAEFSVLNHEFTQVLGISFDMLIAFVVTLILVSTGTCIMQFFASIAFGQSMGKNKTILSIVGYIVFYLINQVISILLLVIFFAPYFSDPAFMNSTNLSSSASIVLPEMSINLLPILISYLVVYIIEIPIFFILAKHFFSKKLNLE